MNDSNQTCRYCNLTDIKAYKIINNYVINYCNNCHLLFTAQSSTITASAINKEWYAGNYVSSYLRRASDIKKRFNQKIRQIELIKRGGNLLDLGCGVGLFLESINDSELFKWKLFGVDINEKLIKEAKTRLDKKVSNLYSGILTSLGFKRHFFDCVVCLDVLEHDNLLESTLNEIKKILKPSGLLLIQSPNQRSVMAYLCGSLWDWWAVPDHIFHFNPQAFTTILKDHGFRIRKLYTWDPREEFIANIRGSIKARLGSNSLLGRLISRCLYIPLLMLWGILVMVEKKFNIGSLLVILAEA